MTEARSWKEATTRRKSTWKGRAKRAADKGAKARASRKETLQENRNKEEAVVMALCRRTRTRRGMRTGPGSWRKRRTKR